MFCEQCGNVISDNAKFCGKCGCRVGETKLICPECGAEYKSGQIYCEQCGVKLSSGESNPVTYNTVEKDTGRNMPATPSGDASSGTSGDMSTDAASPHYNIISFKISGNKIEDINRLRREYGGMRLKEAKDIIDRLYAQKKTAPAPAPAPIHQNNRVKADPNTMICKSPTVTWYKGDKAIGASSVNGILTLYGDRVEFSTTFSMFSSPPDKMYFNDIADVSQGRYMMGSSILITMKNGQKHTFAALSGKLYDFLDQVIEYRG